MAYAAQLETPCTHCCLPALAATAPGLATQRHHAPASGSAPGSRPGAQLPLGDGPLSRSYRQLGPDLTRRKCTACALLPASSVLQSGGYRCHPHHRRNGICSSPIAGFVYQPTRSEPLPAPVPGSRRAEDAAGAGEAAESALFAKKRALEKLAKAGKGDKAHCLTPSMSNALCPLSAVAPRTLPVAPTASG